MSAPEPPPALDNVWSMTIRTAVAITGFTKDTLYGLINSGEIKSFTMGSGRYIDAASLREYVIRRAAEPLQNARLPPRRNGPRAGRAGAQLPPTAKRTFDLAPKFGAPPSASSSAFVWYRSALCSRTRGNLGKSGCLLR